MDIINVIIKKIVLISLFLIIVFSAKAQKYNDIVSDSIINEFVNFYLDGSMNEVGSLYKEKHPFINNSSNIFDVKKLESQLNDWNSIFENDEVNIDSLFTIEDKLFLIKQELTRKKFSWNLEHKFFEFKDLELGKNYFRLSMPLFSKSKNIVIIRRNLECGHDCGDSWIIICKKKNNTWEFISGWGYVI
jgi:hypothetical protein